jgi:Ca2+-binding RTX toxin-like protein
VATFTYSTGNASALASTVAGSGITVLGATMTGDNEQFSIFSGAPELGLSAGVLISSGDANPPQSNTESGYTGLYGNYNSDADLDSVLVGAGYSFPYSYDAANLTITFTATGGNAVKFNLIFGSEEYPEWSDSFPDIAGVFVDGVNYANFAGVGTPLSVLQTNIDAGYFIDNDTSPSIPIEYDGLSNLLTLVAPLNTSLSTHTIKIAIADVNDGILDSAILFSNLTVDNVNAGGVKQVLQGSTGDDDILGGVGADYIELGLGNDSIFSGNGDDILKGNQGSDTLVGGDGFDQLFGGQDGDWLVGNKNGDTIQGALGNDMILGGNGLDRLQGGGGDDTMNGALGADTLVGGLGDDSMVGGGGADVFQFTDGSGVDQIIDFASGEDKLSILVLVNDSFNDSAADYLAAISYDTIGGYATLDLGGGNTVKLIGVGPGDIVESDIVTFG